MELLLKNLQAIERVRPHLFVWLQEALLDENSALKKEADGFFNLEFLGTDQKKHYLYSQHPNKEFERSLQLSKIKDPKILVFNGIGLGYHFFEFLKQNPQLINEVIVIEKNPVIFINALKLHDFTSLIENEKFQFFVNVPETLIAALLDDYFGRRHIIYYANCIEYFHFYPSLALSGKYYVFWAERIQKMTQDKVQSYLVPAEDNYRGLYNICENLSSLFAPQDLAALKGLCAGVPAVIVSSGPSLQHNLAGLKEHQGKYLIASCDSAVKMLLEQGIIPDLIFSLERVAAVELIFESLPRNFDKPLFAMPTIHPKALKQYPGKVVFLSRDSSFGKWLWPDRPSLYLGSSVATMAFRVLTYLGCNDIALLGQDLSYDRKTKRSHVAGVDEKIQKAEEALYHTEYFCELMGNDGQLVPSTTYWAQFLRELEGMIQKFQVQCRNVMPENVGAKINHAQRVDPDVYWTQVAPAYAQVSDKDRVENKIKQWQSGAAVIQSDNLLQKTQSYLEKVEQKSLALAREISLVFHEEMPLIGSAKEMMTYQNHFLHWQEKRLEIYNENREFFERFLFCLVSAGDVGLICARESLSTVKLGNLNYIFQYIDFTQAWLKDLNHWSQRANLLLEDYIKASPYAEPPLGKRGQGEL